MWQNNVSLVADELDITQIIIEYVLHKNGSPFLYLIALLSALFPLPLAVNILPTHLNTFRFLEHMEYDIGELFVCSCYTSGGLEVAGSHMAYVEMMEYLYYYS